MPRLFVRWNRIQIQKAVPIIENGSPMYITIFQNLFITYSISELPYPSTPSLQTHSRSPQTLQRFWWSRSVCPVKFQVP